MLRVLISCEHGGSRVPPVHRELFRGRKGLLESHRGFDPGSLALGRALARRLGGSFHPVTVTRLLVDLNRSPSHNALFSEITRGIGSDEKREILDRFYWPHRRTVESLLRGATHRDERVLHLSVHTFTPVLDGKTRRADLGILYDPARSGEKSFARGVRDIIRVREPDLRVRFNYPYRGAADGFTTWLRRRFPEGLYLGIELEVNQKFPLGPATPWRAMRRSLVASLEVAVEHLRRG